MLAAWVACAFTLQVRGLLSGVCSTTFSRRQVGFQHSRMQSEPGERDDAASCIEPVATHPRSSAICRFALLERLKQPTCTSLPAYSNSPASDASACSHPRILGLRSAFKNYPPFASPTPCCSKPEPGVSPASVVGLPSPKHDQYPGTVSSPSPHALVLRTPWTEGGAGRAHLLLLCSDLFRSL